MSSATGNSSFRYLYTTGQVREADRIAIEELGIAGLVLMKRAALACVREISEAYSGITRVAVFCGTGNNAADGYIIAGLLADRGLSVVVCMIGKIPAPDTDASSAFEFCTASAAEVYIQNEADELPAHRDHLQQLIADADLVVDALLGTGVKGDVRDHYRRVIDLINASATPVLSVDLPSGLCGDTGSMLGVCVRASITVTFIGVKLGLMTNDGPEYTGRLVFSDLDVPAMVFDADRNVAVRTDGVVTVLQPQEVLDTLPVRHRNSHKVTHGHLLIVGGAQGMGGAVILAAQAAIHCGCGLVTVATQGAHINAILARQPEVMAREVSTSQELQTLVSRATAIVLGPGLGQTDWSQSMFAALTDVPLPMVIDADGLNLLALSPRKLGQHVLTPHPGEASRLLPDFAIQSDRRAAVARLQAAYGGVTLLKGAGTLIKDGKETFLVPFGNPAMAVAGMGDILSGVIGSLLAQGLSGIDATKLGALVHSLAGDEVATIQGNRGLLASELIRPIRRILNRLPLQQ